MTSFQNRFVSAGAQWSSYLIDMCLKSGEILEPGADMNSPRLCSTRKTHKQGGAELGKAHVKLGIIVKVVVKIEAGVLL